MERKSVAFFAFYPLLIFILTLSWCKYMTVPFSIFDGTTFKTDNYHMC